MASLFQAAGLEKAAPRPLADRLRPERLADVVGQDHLLGPDGALTRMLDSGTLALSSGPVKDPQGNVVGIFNSIWRLEADGRWRVVFDKGCQK